MEYVVKIKIERNGDHLTVGHTFPDNASAGAFADRIAEAFDIAGIDHGVWDAFETPAQDV